ncbi:substrate-binding periplasmic protein [Gimesia sp.]|uniref:substrate-binding periplasmic protein n=1 Tax=Gimesia sp. TaxID=2024833 RepID=UPI003A94509B
MLRLLSFVTFLVGFSLPGVSHAETLKVCYDQWPPMTIFPSEGSPARGVIIDMLDAIFTSEGYELEYFEVPLARGLDMVANGICDMLPENPVSDATGKGFVYANQETFSYTTAFVIRRGDPWRYTGIKSMAGKHVATGPGWDYSSMSADYQNYLDDPENASFVEVVAGYDDVVDRIFNMIKGNRVDLYADNDLVLQYVMKRLNLDDALQIVRPGLEKNLVEKPIFSTKIPPEKRQNLINIWDRGRLSMKGDKEKSLLRKYGITVEQ